MAKKRPKPKKSGKSRVGEPPKVEELTSPPVARDWRAALKEFAEGVKELYGPRLHSVILYGSRARGDAEPDSDVDVLIVLRDLGDSWEEAKRMSPLATRASMNHNVVITVRPADVVEFETSQSPLFINCRREGVRVE